eukprot:IDg23580t1
MGWQVPTKRKLGHIFLEWGENKIMFTKTELQRLHRAFYHPSDEKLLNLMRRAKPKQAETHDAKLLKEISKKCDTCQKFGPKPNRFQVTLPKEEDLVFGEELSMDLMNIRGNKILHLICTSTRFSAAVFVDLNEADYGQGANGLWEAFLDIWCTVYTGYPARIRADAGSAFKSKRWRELYNNAGIELVLSGVEAHNSIGVEFPTQRERMKILSEAHMEMNTIIAEKRIATALQKNVTSAVDRVYKIGD